ncbi:ion channel [Proteinivorax hydrogeniformans]|uniref:Ion channel n=1 Tax=Proteinivorax hydrogeniformans TaxID=1826727 RepID=A0AAU8HRA3_9FIRM
MSRRAIIVYNILILFFLYMTIAAFFAFLYIAIEILELGSIVDHHASISHQQQIIDLFTRSIYFSFITLFAVGYGDVSPLGLAKGVAIFQALVGYVLPYAIILNYLVFKPKIIRWHVKKRR